MTIILFPCVPIDSRGLSQSVKVEEGKNATLSCNATGNPVLKISWFKDGSYITRSSTINLSADQKHLTINNMSRTDGGEYLCVVKSNLGNYSITAFKLDVHCEYYGICISHFHHYIFCIVLKNSNGQWPS